MPSIICRVPNPNSAGSDASGVGRRGFLAAGAGAFLCTIGGQDVLISKPGDAAKADAIAARVKRPPNSKAKPGATTPAGASEGESTLEEMLPGSPVHDPANQVISSEELRSLVDCLASTLSELESRVLALYLDGRSYEEIGGIVDCDTKTVDNALQRVKRKVGCHLDSRNVAA